MVLLRHAEIPLHVTMAGITVHANRIRFSYARNKPAGENIVMPSPFGRPSVPEVNSTATNSSTVGRYRRGQWDIVGDNLT